MPDCQQVLPSDGVSAWTRDLSHSQREAQEHKHTQTLNLQLTERKIHINQLFEEGLTHIYEDLLPGKEHKIMQRQK